MVLLYGIHLPVVALVVFVVHTVYYISYICDSMWVRGRKGVASSTYYMSFYRGKTWHKRKDFVFKEKSERA